MRPGRKGSGTPASEGERCGARLVWLDRGHSPSGFSLTPQNQRNMAHRANKKNAWLTTTEPVNSASASSLCRATAIRQGWRHRAREAAMRPAALQLSIDTSDASLRRADGG